MQIAEKILVDNFAGGGGASLGLERGTGKKITIAINHSRDAIEMHSANHPETRHFTEDLWKFDIDKDCPEDVSDAWFSPDCRHFSRAKGGVPVSPRVRGLAVDCGALGREETPHANLP